MVGPASTTASSAASASAASGQRKFKSPSLLWVCMLGTVLVLLAQPYGVSADTSHQQQRRKLTKTTDAARNQVLTKRAFGG